MIFFTYIQRKLNSLSWPEDHTNVHAVFQPDILCHLSPLSLHSSALAATFFAPSSPIACFISSLGVTVTGHIVHLHMEYLSRPTPQEWWLLRKWRPACLIRAAVPEETLTQSRYLTCELTVCDFKPFNLWTSMRPPFLPLQTSVKLGY